MANILIVDDHPAIRMAVSVLLKSKGHNIVGEFDNGIDALALIRDTCPDVLVLDINIPRLDGFDVIQRCKSMPKSPRIVVLSANDSIHIKSRCIRLGVSAFVSKIDDLTKLTHVISNVLRGAVLFDHEVYFGATSKSNVEAFYGLSNREVSVLMALARGNTNKKIANDLILSEKTISTYKTRLMKKLNVSNIVELIDFVRKNNLE